VNPRWRENPIFLQFLLGLLLFLFLTALSYLIGLLQPSVSGLALFARSNSTRTAIALTFQALMGPFPTATGPTPTPSWTPSMTPTPTVTPSNVYQRAANGTNSTHPHIRPTHTAPSSDEHTGSGNRSTAATHQSAPATDTCAQNKETA
jgi:hypothetical protein